MAYLRGELNWYVLKNKDGTYISTGGPVVNLKDATVFSDVRWRKKKGMKVITVYFDKDEEICIKK